MKINSIKTTNFGKTFYIIDMHSHDKSIKEIANTANPNDITKFINKSIQIGEDEFILQKTIPSALSGIVYKEENKIKKPYANEWDANKTIIETYKGTSVNNFFAVCQPLETNGNPQTIMKLLDEDINRQFVGLKFHPKFSELEANSFLYDAYLNLANKKNLPCLFHSDRTFDTQYFYTQNGENLTTTIKRCDYSRPDQIYELAKRHPNVPIIMGHMGGAEANDVKTAIDIILESADKNNAKLYADFSWVDADNPEKPNLIEAIRRLKNREQGSLLDRILFGSDMPIDRFQGEQAESNYKKLIFDINYAVKKAFNEEADDILDKIFFQNSNSLLFKKNSFKEKDIGGGKTPKPKWEKYIFAGIITLGIVIAGVKYYSSVKNANEKPTTQK